MAQYNKMELIELPMLRPSVVEEDHQTRVLALQFGLDSSFLNHPNVCFTSFSASPFYICPDELPA